MMTYSLRPTTKDLAKAAGVSRATVDRVLNARDGVKQKTVDKVNAAIRELGFVRNLQAANLARQRNYNFIFALPRSGGEFVQQIERHVDEAKQVFLADDIWASVEYISENDPHSTSDFLASIDPALISGVAIMAPETPQVRDAIKRLQERNIAALPFISNQSGFEDNCVGIDNRAAGATAATLLGRFIKSETASLMVVSESMQSRDSQDRRLGFDDVLNADFPNLRALPSLETYGDWDRAESIIASSLANNADIAGLYIMSSEAEAPVTALKTSGRLNGVVTIAHERTPFTEQALHSGAIDAIIAQNTGHLVRSAIRRLKGIIDNRETLKSQETIRTEILLKTNL
nr:LacI family DNA-binding transcriptional regulator [Amylibacter sp.]